MPHGGFCGPCRGPAWTDAPLGTVVACSRGRRSAGPGPGRLLPLAAGRRQDLYLLQLLMEETAELPKGVGPMPVHRRRLGKRSRNVLLWALGLFLSVQLGIGLLLDYVWPLLRFPSAAEVLATLPEDPGTVAVLFL